MDKIFIIDFYLMKCVTKGLVPLRTMNIHSEFHSNLASRVAGQVCINGQTTL